MECIAKSLSRHKNGRAHVYWSEQSCEVLLSGMRRVLQSSETEERESFKTAVVELKLVGALISGAKSRGVEMLADFLAAFPALEHLDLHCCVLQRDCADAIASGLHASSLTHLDISGTLLGSEGFVPAFNVLSSLSFLILSRNQLGPTGANKLLGGCAGWMWARTVWEWRGQETWPALSLCVHHSQLSICSATMFKTKEWSSSRRFCLRSLISLHSVSAVMV